MANPALSKSFKTAAEEYKYSNMVDAPKMTLQGTVNKTLIMFAVVVGSALMASFNLRMLVESGLFYPALWGSMLGALGLSLWVAFSKKVQVGGIIGYSVLEGVFIGLFSAFLNALYPGIVMQAVTATLVTAGVIFLAWKAGWIKVNDRFMKFMFFALIGYLIFGLINIGFALLAGVSVYSSEFGWIIALIGCGLAAFSLATDFHVITKGVEFGLPRDNEWRGAFGLMVTLIWLYVEILRLLAITRQ